MLCAFITAGVAVLDQISKAIVVAKLGIHEEAAFIPHVLSFCRSENTGMAWGLLKDRRWFFITVSILALVGFAVLYRKTKKPHILFTLSMGFILGGGIGNMADRLFRPGAEVEGCAVVDFLKFEFMEFPIFNVADSFITVGAVLLVVYLLFFDRKREYALFFGRRAVGETNAGADGTNAGSADAGGTGAGSADAGGTNVGGTDAGGMNEGETGENRTGASGTDEGRTDAGGTDADAASKGGDGRHA